MSPSTWWYCYNFDWDENQ